MNLERPFDHAIWDPLPLMWHSKLRCTPQAILPNTCKTPNKEFMESPLGNISLDNVESLSAFSHQDNAYSYKHKKPWFGPGTLSLSWLHIQTWVRSLSILTLRFSTFWQSIYGEKNRVALQIWIFLYSYLSSNFAESSEKLQHISEKRPRTDHDMTIYTIEQKNCVTLL